MTLENIEESRNLLHSQAHIWNHSLSIINPMLLKCAIQLQIPDIINSHGAPMLLSELVQALSIKPEKTHFVYRLMRLLVHLGFFITKSASTNDEEEKEGYLLAPVSRLLLKDEPLSIRPFLLAFIDLMIMDPMQNMSTWFQNDNNINPFHMTYGATMWDFALKNSNFNDSFNEAMASDARLVTSVFLEHCEGVFEGLHSLVDVGGGNGTLARSIAKVLPNVKCICFDLPNVVKGLKGSDNLSYVCGDMFDFIPKADAVLLKWILHDWNDEECVKILKRCKEAIPSKEDGGKLIIIEMVVKIDEVGTKSLENQLFFDMMMMMIYATGRERSEKDWAKLLIDAGFSNYKITPILGLRSVIEVYP
ncbi:trans-resveratrol di-O-methyltransferase-like [Rutidosis leptorrhynchoides]|uniref:trans-resveratrol di-O-methyltransferase-like n=1 Tax=Rutidosis leptorrhynchoides TaxID=125765 RepID=UPI003A9A20A0